MTAALTIAILATLTLVAHLLTPANAYQGMRKNEAQTHGVGPRC
jgi:hypothetical protein